MNRIRVLVLEPDQWRYFGLLHVLSSAPEIELLGEEDYNKILSMTRAAKHLRPEVLMLSHIVLCDFKLPLLGRIKELFPQSNILVHGYEAKVDKIVEILVNGAKGYFLLSSPSRDLPEAVKLVSKGLIWGPPEALVLTVEQARKKKPVALPLETKELVTPYELTILRLLAEGLSNKEIANKLGVAEVTIKSHLSKLYRRFKVQTRLQLFSYAISHNLVPFQRAADRAEL